MKDKHVLIIGGILLILLLFLVPVSATPDWYLTEETGIHPETAWYLENLSENTDEIIVAVLSTGIDYTHPDLISSLWTNTSDGTHGVNVITSTHEVMDTNGYGTHCAGIISSIINSSTSTNIKIMSIVVGTPASVSSMAKVNGIDTAVNLGADIICITFGSDGYAQTEYDSIRDAESKGVLCICVAGDTGRDSDANPTYPANYPLSNLVSVAGSNLAGCVDTSYSCFGSANISLTAPGTTINSTYLQSVSSYNTLSGTAMSASMVAGSAAVIKAINSSLSPSEIKTILTRNTNPLSTGSSAGGSGLLNLSKAAIAAALTDITPKYLTVNDSIKSKHLNASGNESFSFSFKLFNRYYYQLPEEVTYNVSPATYGSIIDGNKTYTPTRNVTLLGNETNVSITITSVKNTNLSHIINLTIVPIYPETINISPVSTSLLIGSTTTFKGNIYDQTGENLTDFSLTWNSSNPAVGIINESTGNFTAISAGITIITANITGSPVNATAIVTVTELPKQTVYNTKQTSSEKYPEQTIINPSSANSEFIGTTQTPTSTPTSTSLPIPTVATSKPATNPTRPSPAPIAGLIAGLGIAILVFAKRR